MLYLRTEFNKYYGAWLKPYGFHKIKGMSCFGRTINNEIFQYIMPHTKPSLIKGKKSFDIIMGIWSIYSNTYYDKIAFENKGNCFVSFIAIDDKIKERYDELYQFDYDDSDMYCALERSFAEVQNIMLPYLDRVKTLEDYVQYLKDFRPGLLRFVDRMNNEGIILVKANDHDDFMGYYQKMCDIMLENFANNPNDPSYIECIKKDYNFYINEVAGARDKVYNAPDLYEKAMQELERRKQKNTAVWKAKGFL